MSATPQPQLYMRRPTLENLPPRFDAPGYHIRSFQPGDGAHWERIIADSFHSEPGKMSFDRTMRADPAFRPHRVLFACCGDEPVGTTSAYIRPAFMPRAGMIHYVGVMNSHGGKSLGRSLMSAALQVMRRERRAAAWLSTDDFRLPAIKLYLAFGFEPLMTHESHRTRWSEVFRQLGRPELSEQFAAILNGLLWSPAPAPAEMGRYNERLRPRRRWHPTRPCGTLKVDDATARDDESLYPPSTLGAAAATVTSVSAGAPQPFELVFRCGDEPLHAGAEVRFYWPGQGALGTEPQIRDSKAPGFIELAAAPQTVAAEALATGFRVVKGSLEAGQEIRLAIGRTTGFIWTPLAGVKNLDVIIDVGQGEPHRRLPEPIQIEILPRDPARLEVILPSTAVEGTPVELTVSMRDRYDNRVPVDGPVEVAASGAKTTAYLSRGLGRAVIARMPKDKLRTTAAGWSLEGSSNPCVASDELHLFIGDLHVHELCSASEGFITDVYRWARDDKRLDFLSVSVQCHHFVDNEKWFLVKQMAEAFLTEGQFVTFPAFEWQHSHYGDKIVHYLGGDMPYLPVDDPRYAHPSALYETLRGTDALIISHHPGYETDLWVPGTDFDAMETDVDRCLELWSMHGSSEGYDPADRPLIGKRREAGVMGALRNGLRVGLVAGSDTHSGRPGGSANEPRPYWGGLCAVWAEKLTRRSLFDAIRARRTYALTQARIVLRFTVNDAPMGSELPLTPSVRIRVDAWAPSPIARIEVLKNTAAWRRQAGHGDEAHLAFEDAADKPAFYHCRITLADGNLAVCTPVWVG